MLKTLLLASLCAVLRAQEPPDPPVPDPPIIVPNCTAFDPSKGEVCTISDLNYTISGANQTLDISYDGSISIINTLIGCNDTCTLPNGTETERWLFPQLCCQLKINATMNVTIDSGPTISNITNSQLKVNNIEIYAGYQFKLGNGGRLNATGMGNIYGPGYMENQNGGSFAAQAGFFGQIQNNLTSIYGTYYQTPSNTQIEYQYGSGAGDPKAIGGGRIVIFARSFQSAGRIQSRGTPYDLPSNSSGGGSGGYIYIKQIIDDPQPGQNFSYGNVNLQIAQADGGNGINSGGSGGRLVLDLYYRAFNSITNLTPSITALGGQVNNQDKQDYFQQLGGPGTIFFKNESKLYIRGPNIATTQSAGISTTSPMAMIHNIDDRDLQNYNSLSQLYLSTNGVVTFQKSDLFNDTKVSVNNITLENNGNLISNMYQKNGTLMINSDIINIKSFSQIQTKQTNLTVFNTTYSFTLDSSSKINGGQYFDLLCDQAYLNGSITLSSNNPLNIQNKLKLKKTNITMKQFQKLVYSQPLTYLTIIANTSMNIFTDVSLDINNIFADRIFFYSQGDINITSKIKSLDNTKTQTCSYDTEQELFSFVQSQQQIPLNQSTMLRNFGIQFNIDTSQMSNDLRLFRNLVSTNFTYTIIAMNRIKLINPDTKIQTSRFGAYARVFEIEGIIDTSGYGCLGSDGLGRGRATGNCTGSGASHGGKGGSGTAINQSNPEAISKCSQFQSENYGGYDRFQALEGSGGGIKFTEFPPDKNSAGGGFIWIQSGQLILNNQAKLNANGNPASAGNGGGSGGSIVLATNTLQGSATIEAKGGKCEKQTEITSDLVGGAGSGGRIKFYYFSWFNTTIYPKNLQITVDTQGGESQTYLSQNLSGQRGSIWSPPCAPGFYGFFCQPCVNGTYKTEYSNLDCQPCQNMPPEAINSAYYTEWQSAMPSCPYECKPEFTQFSENPKCLSQTDLFFDNIGGESVFIILILATFLGIIIVIYTLYQRNKKKDDDFEIDEKLNKLRLAFEELDFIQRDLYQHVSRVYLVGNNEINSPWVVPLVPPAAMSHRINPERYLAFVNQINACYQHTKLEKFLSYSLPILYPVLKPLMNKLKRKQRYYAFKQAFIQISDKMDFWTSVDDQLNIEVRFTASDDYTLGFIDFLDTKRTRDSYQKPPLPMTILVGGTGSFAKPFNIPRHDPLTRAVNSCLDDSTILIWDMFLANLNSRLQAICIQNFGFLVRWRLLQVLAFINEYSKKVFEKRGLKLNLYLIEANNFTSGSLAAVGSQNNEQPIEEEYYILNYEYLRKKKVILDRFIQYWRTESFYNTKKVLKLALVITPLNHQEIMTQSPKINRQVGTSGRTQGNPMSPRKMSQTLQNGIKHISQNLLKSNQRLSGETLQSNNITKIVTQTSYNSTNDVDYVQLLIGTVKISKLDYNKIKVFREYKYGRLESNDDNFEEQNERKNSLRDTLIDTNDISTCQILTYYFQQTLLGIAAFIKSLTLRHSVVVESKVFILTSILFMILVFADIISTAVLCIILNTSQNQILVFYLFYPLANVLSPLFGVLSAMICKSFLYRASAYMNALSLFTNTLSVMIAIIVEYSSLKDKSQSQKLPYCIAMLVSKLILAQLLSVQIAYFRNPEYYVYHAKLQEQVEQADKEDQELRNKAMNMDMILEKEDDLQSNYGVGSAYGGGGNHGTKKTHNYDMALPGSLPDNVAGAGGLYSQKGGTVTGMYRAPPIISRKSYLGGESEDDGQI